jgi:hypothetical protein
MKFFRYLIWAVLFFGIINPTFSQDYGPIKLKKQDIKTLKSKVLTIPVYDPKMGFCKLFIDPTTFKACKTDKKVQDEYKRRWDTAIKASTYDLTSFEFKYMDLEKLKNEKDKTILAMMFDHDFYDNWYVYLAVFEPKYEIVAVAPINGIDLANIEDLKTMMNMLAYSMINTYSFYGDDAKALYRGHENKYRNFVNAFSDTLKSKVFLIPQFDKERKKFKKYNEKLSEYVKQNWKLTKFEILPPVEYKKRVAEGRPNDYYIKSYNINTDNSIITYHYFAVMSTSNNDMIHGYMGLQYINPNNIKYFQIYMERWMFKFMEKKKRDKYLWVTPLPKEEKKKNVQPKKETKQATQVKSSKDKTPPPAKKTEAPKKGNPPKSAKPDSKSK